MKNVVRFFCITGAVAVLCTASAWAVDDRHAPVFKFWVVDVYEEVGGELVNKYPDPPGFTRTQTLAEGVAIAGDFINVEVTIGGWDAFPDVGHCDGYHVPAEECSITSQDCTGKHCEVGGSTCEDDGDCGVGDCVDDVCIPYPVVDGWQWMIDSSTYYNDGSKMGLAPAEVPCVADSDCYCGYDPVCHATAVPPVNNCTCSTAVCDTGTCDTQGIAYINKSNSDYVFLNLGSIVAVSTFTPDYSYAGNILPNTESVVGGEDYYAGTLLLEVLDDACGEFVIDMRVYDAAGSPSLTWAVDDKSATLPDAEVEPLTLNFLTAGDGQCGVGCHGTPPQCMMDWCNPCYNTCEFVPDNDASCPDDGNPCTDDYCDGGTCVHPNNTDPCDDDDLCTLNDYCGGGVCSGTPKYCPPETPWCNPATGECEVEPTCDWATAEPYPPHCAIDARQPNPVSNDPPTPQGWDSLTLTFAEGCDTSILGLVASDFTTSVTPAGDSRISVVDPVTAVGQTITVQLDRTISPEYWTCITHTGTSETWCLGFLPADVNGDRLSNTADISALIDSINAVPGRVRPDYATDIDRSTITTPSDILREIDLLNGAGDLGVWITKDLPDCPEG